MCIPSHLIACLKTFILISLLWFWHRYFVRWLNNTLNNNTIRCKKLTTIVSSRKYIAHPLSGENRLARVPKCNNNIHCCYILDAIFESGLWFLREASCSPKVRCSKHFLSFCSPHLNLTEKAAIYLKGSLFLFIYHVRYDSKIHHL